MWKTLKRWFHQLGSPRTFYRFSGMLIPWLFTAMLVTLFWGLYQSLLVAPPDYQQGESYRILYVHVPSAWMGLFIYVLMAASGLIGLVWRMKVAELVSISCAPIGAAYTFVTLVTGSLWGKPMWGTWWEWDARLTSELFLLFLYLGVMGLYAAIEDRRKAARAAALLALVGVVNLPIIHYSVVWWNTLHQGATVKLFSGESHMHPSMLKALLIMTAATKFHFGVALLQKVRARILQQESKAGWVQELIDE